ncbi:hypothetical protein F5148DRAFT_1336353 [Russula earlei]|uniref:Uncharacterized protein n=1 Tax=Russula earlei TaxID=71964 RepID=A0ACC0TXR1_9AGAM|nr:hypothetical protein F5148DRAFT_1336353 [Russula earlei]
MPGKRSNFRLPIIAKTIAYEKVFYFFPGLSAQTNFYYNGSGVLTSTGSWGTNTDGTGTNPVDFTQANYQYIIQNTVSVSLNGSWTVSGTGSRVILGNPTVATAPITLTLLPGSVLTVPSTSFDISVPSSGHQKIIYQNSTIISFGNINDANLELVFDGSTITTSSTKTYGDISLINSANVTMISVGMVVHNLSVDATSTLTGPTGSSSQYIAIKSGGSVTINGYFKAGRTGGLITTGVAIPVVTNTSYATLLFQDATANITLGNASTIEYNRGTSGQTAAQTIDALSYNNLILSNSAVASNKQFAAGVINVSGTFTINLLATSTITAPTQNINLKPGAKLLVSSATAFPTGGKLVVQSDPTGTASIGELVSGATITGNVTVQQYIPGGYRKYRFLSHPFTTSQALSQLTDNIDITGNAAGTTGAGGQTTGSGFTSTPTNNPSAYYFNTASANGDASNDGGWIAFTDATTSSWAKGQGIRVLVRGTKGQAGTLDGTNATPNAVTLDMNGVINTGAVSVNLVTGGTGSTTGFNLVGNPYPSPVDIGAVLTSATNIGSSFYVRNPQTGSYTTINPIPASYVLPAWSAFFVKATAATSLNFTESNKNICTTCPTVFGAADRKNYLQLKAINSGLEYDNLHLNIGNSYNNAYDESNDAIKLANDGFNLYALSADGQKLAANYFSATHDSIIPLGIVLSSSYGVQTYSLIVSDYNMDAAMKLVLHDKLNNSYTELKGGAAYDLAVDPSNNASVGEGRLELLISTNPLISVPGVPVDPTGVSILSTTNQFMVKYNAPNPIHNANIRLLNVAGQVLYQRTIANQQQAEVVIPTNGLLGGVYVVQLQLDKESVTRKLVK